MGLNSDGSEVSSKPTPFESLCSTFPSSIEQSHSSYRNSPTISQVISPSPVINEPLKDLAFRTNRQRLHVSQTPLRQVLSKSLQKALKDHGRMAPPVQRKIAFNSMSSTSSDSDSICMPIDLRTTPALKRSNQASQRPALMPPRSPSFSVESNHSQMVANAENAMNEAHQESSLITSRYLSCQPENTFSHFTPQKKGYIDSDIWHSPQVYTSDDEDGESNNDNKKVTFFSPEAKKTSPEPKYAGLLTKMFWFGGGGGTAKQQTSSIFYKAASLAGWIRKRSGPENPRKRPRVNSFTSPPSTLKSPVAKKYKAIQGRKPIRRMQMD